MPALFSVPLWAVVLRLLGGGSDATSVPVAMMGDHMQMTQRTAPTRGDAARAAAIVRSAHAVMNRYVDVETAERDGYRLFHAEPIGAIEHYTSVAASRAEARSIDYDRPGSLLYRHDAAGDAIVGVMYGAPGNADAAQLDARAPLSIAAWHRHVNFCIGGSSSDPRFGFGGTIHTHAACDAANGYFLPLAFGWMTHVFPKADASGVWGGDAMRPDSMPVK